jgi:hypothetical protein
MLIVLPSHLDLDVMCVAPALSSRVASRVASGLSHEGAAAAWRASHVGCSRGSIIKPQDGVVMHLSLSREALGIVQSPHEEAVSPRPAYGCLDAGTSASVTPTRLLSTAWVPKFET